MTTKKTGAKTGAAKGKQKTAAKGASRIAKKEVAAVKEIYKDPEIATILRSLVTAFKEIEALNKRVAELEPKKSNGNSVGNG